MPPTRLKQGLAALVLAATSAAALGCGGSNDSNQFLGIWKITQASAMGQCSDGNAYRFTPNGNIEFAPGVTTALVETSSSELDGVSLCDFTYTVSGATATISPGQTCALLGFSTAQVQSTFSPSAWTFSLTGPNNAEEIGTASLILPGADPTTQTLTGQPANCTYTAHMATLTRVARN